MRDKYGRFIKGHESLPGIEKGWFKKGALPYSHFHPEIMPKGKNHSHPRSNGQGYIKRANLILGLFHPFR